MDEETPTPQPEPDREDRDESPRDQPMLYCPVCSQRLVSRKCKLLCERCGYFMSCADYY
jgi:hypothetical protein